MAIETHSAGSGQVKICRRGHEYKATSSYCPVCWPAKKTKKRKRKK